MVYLEPKSSKGYLGSMLAEACNVKQVLLDWKDSGAQLALCGACSLFLCSPQISMSQSGCRPRCSGCQQPLAKRSTDGARDLFLIL